MTYLSPGTRLHAVERAQEHYGVTLTRADLDALCRKCEIGTAPLVRAYSRGAEIRLVKHGETVLVAVYDPQLKLIKTFLNKDAVTSKRFGHFISAGRYKSTTRAPFNHGRKDKSGTHNRRQRRPEREPDMEDYA